MHVCTTDLDRPFPLIGRAFPEGVDERMPYCKTRSYSIATKLSRSVVSLPGLVHVGRQGTAVGHSLEEPIHLGVPAGRDRLRLHQLPCLPALSALPCPGVLCQKRPRFGPSSQRFVRDGAQRPLLGCVIR